MSEHTAGPWSLLCDEARGRPRCLIVDAKGNEIAAVNPFRESWNEDADLMKAAPELLDALEEIRSDPDIRYRVWIKAHEAIKKARGKSD